jgi:hypothetical protein
MYTSQMGTNFAVRHRMFVGKPEGRCYLEDLCVCLMILLKGKSWECENWIHSAQDRDLGPAVVNTAMNI